MLENYVPIFLLTGISIIFGIVGVNVSWLFGPQRPYREKRTTYESGVDPISTAHYRFSVKYYMVALSFIIFDIEVVFMYPWAVRVRELGAVGFVVIMVFIVVLAVGYIYEWKKGAFQWD